MAKNEKLDIIVSEVIDGDTFKGDAILPLDIKKGITVRVLGLNSPELHKGTDMEKAEGIRAKWKANSLLQGKTVKITTAGEDKYGRTLADVTLPDGTNFTKTMIAQGFGKAMVMAIATSN